MLWDGLLAGPAIAALTIDRADLVNVDAQTSVTYSGISHNPRTRKSTVNVRVKNISATPISTPLIFVVESISEPTVTVANADGTTTPDGKPLYDLTGQVPGNTLDPAETTSNRALVFNNPNLKPFTIQASVYQQHVSPPVNVTLSLTTDNNHSVIMQIEPAPFSGIPQGVGEELTVTVTGTTTPTQVQLNQVQQTGGRGQIYFGATGTATSTTVTISGGTPNQAKVVVRYAQTSGREGDIKIEARVNGNLSGEKFVTAIRASISPQCGYISDQRGLKQTLTVQPSIAGLKFNVQAFAAHQNTANPSNLPGIPTQLTTDANGISVLEFLCNGYEVYCVICVTVESTDSEETKPSLCFDYRCVTNRDQKGNPYTDPEPGTSICFNCPGITADDGYLHSVDLSDGEKKRLSRDLSISGRGFDYEFYRVYRSFNYRRNFDRKDFGENWTYSYADEFLVKDSTGADTNANYINFRDGQTGYILVRVAPGVWAPEVQEFVRLRMNPNTGDFELRDQSGMVRVYHNFSDTSTPNKNGRLKAIIDRNDNTLTCHYEKIDPDGISNTGDEKFVLAFVIDTLGREIRYQYYAATAQTVGGRPLTIVTANVGARGRLARVKDFKGDMDFDGTAESEDFPGQTNNRTLTFDYDVEGNLIRCSGPAVTGTPIGNDFPNGKTFRYQYITTTDLPGGLTQAQKDRLLHKLTHIWYPNEVGNTPDTNPADTLAAEVITYETDTSKPFFGFAVAYAVGGTNTNGVPAGGTIHYTYTDLNPTRSMPPGANLDPTILINLQSLKVNVTDRNGNQAEYIYGGEKKMLSYTEFTSGFRLSEPLSYTMTYLYNRDRLLTRRTFPEDNRTNNTYNDSSTDRFQQSNRIRSIRTPDSTCKGDQQKIETVMVYEPIYNRPCLIVFPRGADMTNNDFIPPIADPAGRTMVDPYDPSKTVNLRYVRVEFFDFQEPTEKAAAAPNSRKDIDGSGGQVNQSPLIAVDPNVLTTEVWLVQELGLSEDAAGLTELRNRLTANLTQLGLGDLNGDGVEGVLDSIGQPTPTIAGNIVRTVLGSPVLIQGSNQHALESIIDPIDLINQSLGYMDGGTEEGAQGGRLQTIVSMHQYNRLGQPIQTISPEGNVTTYEYFPEIDPDGDGVNTPATLATDTGGYLKETVGDAKRNDFDQNGVPKNGAFSNNKADPAETDIRMTYAYDDVGNVVKMTNGRGIRTDGFVNEHNQVVQATRAAAHNVFTPDPVEPLSLTDFKYLSRTFYDFNDNVIQTQVEDRGDTSNTGGFVDTTSTYDTLNNRIETSAEVDVTRTLVTRYRYDANGNRVLTISPEDNADSAVYDERESPLPVHARRVRTPHGGQVRRR